MSKKFSVKAVCLGVVAGLICSSVASVVVALIWGVPLTSDKIASSIPNLGFLLADLVLSMAAVLLSGYIAARIGRDNPAFNALIVGIVQLIIAVLAFLSSANLAFPMWYTAATILVMIPAAYGGAKIAMRDKVKTGI